MTLMNLRTYFKTDITQLEKKQGQITIFDQWIAELIQDPDELKTIFLDAEEVQDLILEKINDLNKRVEMLSRQTHVATTLLSLQLLLLQLFHTRDQVTMKKL